MMLEPILISWGDYAVRAALMRLAAETYQEDPLAGSHRVDLGWEQDTWEEWE